MPSDEMVARAQTLDDAIDNVLIAWGMGWDMDGVMACLKEAKDRAALSAAHAEPVANGADEFGAHILSGAIGSIDGREIGPGHVVLSEERYALLLQAFRAETQPVARDPSRFSRLSQDERPVIRDRPDPTLGFISTAELLASPSEAAIRADERAATCKEGLQVEEIRQAILDHCWGDSNGNVNGSILAAEAIATAIRARGET